MILARRHNSSKLIIVLLSLIFLLGCTLRLFQLGEIPEGVTVDEANFGYIAYSLLQTGKDEHNHSWPLSFTAFGEEKLPVGAYILLPSIYFFGPTVFATRLPSAILGSISILLIYFLSCQFKFRRRTGILLAFFWAVSPITFFLSRFAYESNLALTFFLAGLIGMLQLAQSFSPSTKQKIAWPAVITWSVGWGLTWYSYIAYRPIMVVFLLVLGAYWFYRRPELRLSLISVIAIFILMIAPSFIFSPDKNVNFLRFQQIGILSDEGIPLTVNENRYFCLSHARWSLGCSLFWNKPVLMVQELLSRYFHVFSLDYLFLKGESGAYTNVPNYGQFNLIFLIFFIAGFINLLSRRWKKIWRQGSSELILILGLLIGALPAITVGEPPKFRLSPLVPFLFLLTGYGLDYLSQLYLKLRHNYGQKIIFLCLSCALAGYFLFNTTQYFFDFFTIYTYKYDFTFNSYVKNLSLFLKEKTDDSPSAPIYMRVDYPDPLMFYSFFTAYNPRDYQEKIVLDEIDNLDFQHALSLDNLQVTTKTLPKIIELNPDLKTGYYVCHTLENFLPENYSGSDDVEDLPLAYIAYSASAALEYAYVVDIATYLQQFPKESFLKNN